VVLNDVASSVVEGRRGKHHSHVFAFRGKPISHMLNSGWRCAREKTGLRQVRVHDLKHTFGRKATCSRGKLRRSAGSVGAPVREYNDALFCSRADPAYRGSGKGVQSWKQAP
jgi:hypothetical protein